MSTQPRSKIFHGAVINPLSLSSYLALPKCLICVGPSGDIAWVVDDVPDSLVQEVMAQKGVVLDGDSVDFVTLKRGEFLLPGFVDTHTHAPQVPNIGSGQQYELLDWLDNVTFPMEARFANVDFAKRAYESVVKRIINSGTTTCCYYGTLHLEATKILADIVHSHGQRAFVGKCNMNRNCPPSYIEPSVEESIASTKALITHIRTLASPSSSDNTTPALVQPILTPRFAISCTSPLLHSLSSLSNSTSPPHPHTEPLMIQTHISENPSEIAFTLELFPDCTSYADVYDKHGLLGPRTILAHAVHLSEEEVGLVRRRGAGVSHCPTSNFNLRSGVCKVGEMLDRGVKVGLGTDVSGGFSPSILTAIQHASIASKIIAMEHDQSQSSPPTSITTTSPAPSAPEPPKFANRQLPPSALLYLATLGGAHVCDLSSRIGSFTPGKAFDALLVSVRSDAGNLGLWGVDTDEELGIDRGKGGKEELDELLERFLFTGDDRNMRRVYVQGRWIGGAERRV